MTHQITIAYQGDDYQVPAGLTLAELIPLLPPCDKLPLAARINSRIQELDYRAEQDISLEWIDHNSNDGWRIYRGSMVFMLLTAMEQLYPEKKLHVSHSLSDGLYCHVQEGELITQQELDQLTQVIQSYIDRDLPIVRKTVSPSEAGELFRGLGEPDKAALMERLDSPLVNIYKLLEHWGYFYSPMVISCGYLNYFRLEMFGDGFIVHLPAREYLGDSPFDAVKVNQLQATLKEYDHWSRLMGVSSIADLNRINSQGQQSFLNLIQVSETLYENRLHDITVDIVKDFPEVKLVLLAGPSSSGKTTTTMRLSVHFRTQGIEPIYISMDDYFVDREKTPKKPDGSYDFETIHAMDMELFHDNMARLLKGEEVSLPKFDFQTGRSIPNYRRISLEGRRILIVEGLHALNPVVSQSIPAEKIRKLFVSALTQINYDRYTPVPVTDARLIRRMARDMQFRGVDPETTLARWIEVRRGERENIFPYQESADFFVNSALLYETPVLRPLVEPALSAVSPDSPQWEEVQRILTFLRYYQPADSHLVPQNSILREFIGGSVFDL